MNWLKVAIVWTSVGIITISSLSGCATWKKNLNTSRPEHVLTWGSRGDIESARHVVDYSENWVCADVEYYRAEKK